MAKFEFKSFLRNFYLTGFFYEFIFAYAIYTLLFSLRGLSVFEIALLIAWWATASLIFELPGGALADYWSRRNLLVLAPPLKALCFTVWFLADGSFFLYALGFTLWSLSESMASGPALALLFDSLKYAGRSDEYEKILGRSRFYVYIALGIAMVSGGLIAAVSLDWAVIFSVIPLVLSTFFAWRLVEVPRGESTTRVSYLQYFKTAASEIRSNRPLRYLFVYFLGISVFGILEEFDQLYYDLAGLPIFAFGIAGFLWSVLNAGGSYYAYKLKNSRAVYAVLPAVSGLLLAAVALFPGIPMIALLLTAYLLCSPLVVLTESRIQHRMTGGGRATVTSAANFLALLAGILITLLFGLISRIWDLQAIYLSTAVILLLLALGTAAFGRKTGGPPSTD